MTESTAAPAPPRRRPRARRPGVVARVASDPRLAWAVALVLALALAVVAVLATPLALEARDRRHVEGVARDMAARLVTFDTGDLDAWVARVQELSTAAYGREVAGLVSDDVRGELVAAEMVSRGDVVDVFVQRVDAADATAFALVRQTTSIPERDDALADDVRMTLELERERGGWRVSGVAVLPGASAAPPLPDGDRSP